jgi:2'-5' RNA ligase
MSAQHAVVLIPRFDTPDRIEAIRREFDPLAVMLPAHVTLVFPFAEELTPAALRDHVATATTGLGVFDIGLGQPVATADGYLWLTVTEGRAAITELHDRLYVGRLAVYRSVPHAYDPHLTIGRRTSRRTAAAVAAAVAVRLPWPLRARIDAVAALRLSGGMSQVLFSMPLAAPAR